MKLKIPPLAIISLVMLCGLNAWLLDGLLAGLAPPDLTTSTITDNSKNYSKPNIGKVVQKPASAYGHILSKPVFFRSRQPYVPQPVVPPNLRAPAPVVALPDPVLIVTGVLITEKVKKAYVLKQNELQGSWISEGDNLLGWSVQDINSKGIAIKQSNRTIKYTLYPER